jgi:hypothetical protein
MKITIEGKEFEIDLERAKSLGLCKEVRKPLTEVISGGVYSTLKDNQSNVLVIQTNYTYKGERLYQIYGDVLGRERGTLTPFSNCSNPVDKNELLNFLNRYEYELVKTIGDLIVNLVCK